MVTNHQLDKQLIPTTQIDFKTQGMKAVLYAIVQIFGGL